MSTLTRHKHADLILEKARQDVTGETAAGWWLWEWTVPDCKWGVVEQPAFTVGNLYRYSMTAKHPLFAPPTPKLKLVDMLSLPKGSWVTALQIPHVVFANNPAKKTVSMYHSVEGYSVNWEAAKLSITEQKDFTYWAGGMCPVPEGLLVEVVIRTGRRLSTQMNFTGSWTHTKGDYDIIAYRIIGLVEGWTDNPELEYRH